MTVSAAFSFGTDLFGPVCTAAVLVVRDDGATALARAQQRG